jgi:hypothetical protein
MPLLPPERQKQILRFAKDDSQESKCKNKGMNIFLEKFVGVCIPPRGFLRIRE